MTALDEFRDSDWVLLDGHALWVSRHPDVKGWETGILSEDRGEKKQCFYNAWTRSLQGDGHYTEGFAKSPYAGWTHHAWLTDDEGNPIEVTWGHADLQYVGIIVPRDELWDMIEEDPFYDEEEDEDGEGGSILLSYVTINIRGDVALYEECQQRLKDWRVDIMRKHYGDEAAAELQKQQ